MANASRQKGVTSDVILWQTIRLDVSGTIEKREERDLRAKLALKHVAQIKGILSKRISVLRQGRMVAHAHLLGSSHMRSK